MIYRTLGFKRTLDVVVSVAVLAIFGFLIIISGLIILCSSKGPILFLQTRVGKNGRLFQIYKLRTMSIDPTRKLRQTTSSDPEILPVGRILRRFKIDELPQIFNVLKGDMSLIGPRPCLKQTLTEMPPWARKRFEVRPGITGLAQINGNIALTWEERWRYDIDYINRCSFFCDVQIIIRTLLVVIVGEERFRKLL